MLGVNAPKIVRVFRQKFFITFEALNYNFRQKKLYANVQKETRKKEKTIETAMKDFIEGTKRKL
jgi:sRNA-binding carbon storage regulator CsrA